MGPGTWTMSLVVATWGFSPGPRRGSGRSVPRLDLSKDQRVFEVCTLDENANVIECAVVTEVQLVEDGLLGGTDELDMLFTLPGVEKAIPMSDLGTAVGEFPTDVINKAFGPDVTIQLAPPTSLEGRGEQPPLDRVARYHLHFGAGRLGLGLVVPAIAASSVPFGVVQRPKPRWQELFARQDDTENRARIDIAVNEVVRVHNAEVIAADDEKPPTFIPAQSLVFGSSSDDLLTIVAKATSFSCSLGAAMHSVMTTALSELPEVLSDDIKDDPSSDLRPVLYCTENDHAAVARLKKSLHSRVRVVDCMVDRVCTGRRISVEGVEIDAEPWSGSIVVLEPGFTRRQVPFAPHYVTLPRSQREADFLSKRKFSLVNGMHTVLAFHTLHRFYSPTDSGREYVLAKYRDMRRVDQRLVEAWRTARIAELLDEYGSDDIAAWAVREDNADGSPLAPSMDGREGREVAWASLLDFADTVLVERFSEIDDLVSRVLGGGVANRYQTRLVPTYQWLENRLKGSGSASANAPGARRGASSRLSDEELRAFLEYAARRDRSRAQASEAVCDPSSDMVCELIPDDELEDFMGAEEAAEFVLEQCSSIVKESRRFCNKEVEITHKVLIKEQRMSGGKYYSPTVQKALKERRILDDAIQEERRAARQAQAKPPVSPPR